MGNGSSFGGIVVSPLVDSSKGYVYAVSGTNGTSPTMIQVPIAMFSVNNESSAGFGHPPGKNLSVPSFNTNYYSSATSSTWAIFSCGYDSTGSLTELYDVGFNSSAVLNPGTPPSSNEFQLASDVEACSPLTGFENLLFSPPFSPPVNWLFLGLSGGTMGNYNITNATGSGFGGGFGATATYTVAGGPSGIVPDNESTETQASSIYFSSRGTQPCGVGGTGYCAIKLTQSGLN